MLTWCEQHLLSNERIHVRQMNKLERPDNEVDCRNNQLWPNKVVWRWDEVISQTNKSVFRDYEEWLCKKVRHNFKLECELYCITGNERPRNWYIVTGEMKDRSVCLLCRLKLGMFFFHFNFFGIVILGFFFLYCLVVELWFLFNWIVDAQIQVLAEDLNRYVESLHSHFKHTFSILSAKPIWSWRLYPERRVAVSNKSWAVL